MTNQEKLQKLLRENRRLKQQLLNEGTLSSDAIEQLLLASQDRHRSMLNKLKNETSVNKKTMKNDIEYIRHLLSEIESGL